MVGPKRQVLGFLAGAALVVAGSTLIASRRKDGGGSGFGSLGRISPSKRRVRALRRAIEKLDFGGAGRLSPPEVDILTEAAKTARISPKDVGKLFHTPHDRYYIAKATAHWLRNMRALRKAKLDLRNTERELHTEKERSPLETDLLVEKHQNMKERVYEIKRSLQREADGAMDLLLRPLYALRILHGSDNRYNAAWHAAHTYDSQQLRAMATDPMGPLVYSALERSCTTGSEIYEMQRRLGLSFPEMIEHDYQRSLAIWHCVTNAPCLNHRASSESWIATPEGRAERIRSGAPVVPGENELRSYGVNAECWGIGLNRDDVSDLAFLEKIKWPNMADHMHLDGCLQDRDPGKRMRLLAQYLRNLGSIRTHRLVRLVRSYPHLADSIVRNRIPLKDLPVTTWVSESELKDAVLERIEEEQEDYPDDSTARARDRLAQLDPEWAIQEAPEEYERGKQAAPLLSYVLNFLSQKHHREGKRIFVHGRDGELLAEILRRAGVPAAYGLTPRSLTTDASWSSDKEKVAYLNYLNRVCPRRAVHVDTGFAGSVPKWMKKAGFDVDEIWLVSANEPKYQIPVDLSCLSAEVRNIVLDNLEHAAQRLMKPDRWRRGYVHYSKQAPGFWARLYGVADALGLPRQLPRGKKVALLPTQQEKQKKRPLRVRMSILGPMVSTFSDLGGFGEGVG